MKTSASFEPEEVETIRNIALRLFSERYAENQSAMARDLDITQTNVRRFVVVKKGGVSTQTAKKICKLAGVAYPPVANAAAMISVVAMDKPMRKPRTTPIPATIGDDELEKALDFYAGKWKNPTVAAAREATAVHGVKMSRMQWLDALDQLDEMVTTWLQHYDVASAAAD